MILSSKRRAASANVLPGYATPHPRWLVRWIFVAIGLYAFVTGFLFALSPAVFAKFLAIPLGIIALLSIWALPDTNRPPETLLRRAFACYAVAIIIWPYYLAMQIPGLPLVEPRRIANLLAIAALLIGLSVSPTYRGLVKDAIRSMPWFFRFLGAYVAVQVITMAWSTDIGQSSGAVVREQLANTAMLFIAFLAFATTWRWDSMSKILRVLVFILGIMALLEFRNQAILWADSIPSFLKVNDPAMENLLSPVFRDGEYRVTTTFSVSLSFAEFMALAMPFLIQQIMYGKTIWARVIAATLDILAFTAILLTQARVGLVGATVAHAAYGFIWAFYNWRRRPNDLVGPTLVAAAMFGAVLLLLAILFVPAVNIRLLGGGTHTASTEGREEQLANAMALLWGQGVIGFGADRGAEALGHRNPAGELSIDIGYLRVLLDYGVIGFVSYVGLFVSAFVAALRLSMRSDFPRADLALALTSTMGVWLATRMVLAQNDNHSLMFIFLGWVVSLHMAYKWSLSGGHVGVNAIRR